MIEPGKLHTFRIGEGADATLPLLQESLSGFERDLAGQSGTLPRVTLLETEYLRAVAAAELSWVTGAVNDLRTGALTWGDELADMARSFLPD